MSQIAVYKGKEYDATLCRLGGFVWLRSLSSDSQYMGFECEDGIYYKKVNISDVEEVYRVYKYVYIDGMKCEVISESDTDLTIMLDNILPDVARKYGLITPKELGMYEAIISKKDVTIHTEKEAFKL